MHIIKTNLIHTTPKVWPLNTCTNGFFLLPTCWHEIERASEGSIGLGIISRVFFCSFCGNVLEIIVSNILIRVCCQLFNGIYEEDLGV